MPRSTLRKDCAPAVEAGVPRWAEQAFELVQRHRLSDEGLRQLRSTLLATASPLAAAG